MSLGSYVMIAGIALVIALIVVWLITRNNIPKKLEIKAKQKYLCFVVYPSKKGGIVLENLVFDEPPGNPYKYKGNLVFLLKHVLNDKGAWVYQPYEPLSEIPKGMMPEKLFRANRCDPAIRLLQWQSRMMEKIALGSLVTMGIVGMVTVFFILSELSKGKM